MYAVICGYQFSPGYRDVSIAVTCRYDFQGHICQNWVNINLYNVQGTCTETFGSQVITGNRNVSRQTPPVMISNAILTRTRPILQDKVCMGSMQWHESINSPLDIVTLALQSPAVMISRAIFDWFNLYNVKGTCTWTFGSKVMTGNRNVSSTDTTRYDFQRYIFPNKTNIIGHGVNGMFEGACGYQFSPGYRNVSITVTCRYDFQGHICRIKIRFNLYIVKGYKHRHLVQKLSLEIVTLAVQAPPVMISNAIFSRTRPIL